MNQCTPCAIMFLITLGCFVITFIFASGYRKQIQEQKKHLQEARAKIELLNKQLEETQDLFKYL